MACTQPKHPDVKRSGASTVHGGNPPITEDACKPAVKPVDKGHVDLHNAAEIARHSQTLTESARH
jgi:hypothetical protein